MIAQPEAYCSLVNVLRCSMKVLCAAGSFSGQMTGS